MVHSYLRTMSPFLVFCCSGMHILHCTERDTWSPRWHDVVHMPGSSGPQHRRARSFNHTLRIGSAASVLQAPPALQRRIDMCSTGDRKSRHVLPFISCTLTWCRRPAKPSTQIEQQHVALLLQPQVSLATRYLSSCAQQASATSRQKPTNAGSD